MNTLANYRLDRVLDLTTGIAAALLVAAMLIAADPLGRLIGGLIAASAAFGLVGLALHRVEFPTGSQRSGPRSGPLPDRYPEGPVARSGLREATVWAFEESAPDFAPVISLTEARVARDRTTPERREVTAA